jgi:putative transposase
MRDWPHSPAHRLREAGAYMVTAGTYGKEPIFRGHDRLHFLCDKLLELAEIHAWTLEAWAVFANHYHFVAHSPPQPATLRRFIQHLHSVTAKEANRWDETPSRKVWFEYWETRLTYEKSFFARLSYVHKNALHHGLVREPSAYAWCSAGWFERKANTAFYRTIMSFKCDRVRVPDAFRFDSEPA